MTYDEAKEIYYHVHSIVSVFGGDLYNQCLEKGIPEPMLLKILKEEKRLDLIIEALGDIEERYNDTK